MKNDVDISVVIPVYRSTKMLRELAARLASVLGKTGLRYEIIFVDDASPDDSWKTLIDVQRCYPDRVSTIQLMRQLWPAQRADVWLPPRAG